MIDEPSRHPAADADQGPLKRIVYTEGKTYVFSILGGALTVCLMRAYLFRWSHPDTLYQIMACAAGLLIATLLWFPPKLVLDAEGVKGTSFGYLWLDCPWRAIERIELFRTPETKTLVGTMGGRRALGFVIKPDLAGSIKPKSGAYGYGAAIPSMWNFSFDQVADRCAHYWRANGGSGELINRLNTYQSDAPWLLSS